MFKMSMVVHACTYCTWEAETGESGVQGYPQLIWGSRATRICEILSQKMQYYGDNYI